MLPPSSVSALCNVSRSPCHHPDLWVAVQKHSSLARTYLGGLHLEVVYTEASKPWQHQFFLIGKQLSMLSLKTHHMDLLENRFSNWLTFYALWSTKLISLLLSVGLHCKLTTILNSGGLLIRLETVLMIFLLSSPVSLVVLFFICWVVFLLGPNYMFESDILHSHSTMSISNLKLSYTTPTTITDIRLSAWVQT